MNAKIMRWSKTHTLFTVVAILTLVIGVILGRSVMHSVAQSVPACPVNAVNFIVGGVQPAVGTIPLTVNVPASSGLGTVSGVQFQEVTNEFLGVAEVLQQGANGSYWQMQLDTTVMPNGSHPALATIFMASGAKCNTVAMPININNTTGLRTPSGTLGPIVANAPTNATLLYNARYMVGSQDWTRYARLTWSTTLGSVTQEGIGVGRLFTGPTGGTATIMAKMEYAGRLVPKSTTVIIIPAQTGTQSGGTGTTTTTTSQTGTSATSSLATTTNTATAPATASPQTQPAVALQDCASSVLGAIRAAAIKNGTIIPTTQDIEKLMVCFAATNYVVPTNFAPVAPTAVKQLAKLDQAKIIDLSNATIQNKKVIKITGNTKPNQTVFLYVFSEPLVLTTTADSNGDWTYSLEDPLEPGNHEVYAVVDSGNGTYEKTDPFSFVIGKATASSENPNGLSLQLENDATPLQSNRNLYIYAAIFGAIILVGLVVILLLFRRWNNHNNMPPSSFGSSPPTFMPPPPPSNPIYPA